MLQHAPFAAVGPTAVAMSTPRPTAASSSTFNSPFSIALRNRLQDLSLRQDTEVDEEAKRATLARRVRLYALAVTRRIDEEEEVRTVDRRGRLRRTRRKKRPTVADESGAPQQWSRLLLEDGRAIGYVLAPVGGECRRGGGRRRPFNLVRVTILDEMTERDQEDSSD